MEIMWTLFPHLRVLLRAGVHAQQRRESSRVVNLSRPLLHVAEHHLELLKFRDAINQIDQSIAVCCAGEAE